MRFQGNDEAAERAQAGLRRQSRESCFKFRHKIGLDVALEALKEAWQQHKLNLDRVAHFAEVNRVSKVMQPHLETVVA
jgi:hypothetical protein